MEGLESNTKSNEAALTIDQAQSKCDQDHEYALPSAHTVGLGMQFLNFYSEMLVGLKSTTCFTDIFHGQESYKHCMLYGYFSWPRKL